MALSKITNDGIDNITIGSSGNVGIGTSSPNADLELGGTGEIMRLSGSSTNAYIRNTDGTTNQWYIGSGGNAGLQHYIYQAQPMTFHTNGSERMRILSSGGITFNGDTAAANALYDYEYGTFTPTLAAGTVSTASGYYIKIGNLVKVGIRLLTFSDTTSATGLEVTNLPFNVNTPSMNAAGGAVFSSYCSPAPNASYVNTTGLSFFASSTTGTYTAIAHSNLNNANARFFCEATYYTTS